MKHNSTLFTLLFSLIFLLSGAFSPVQAQLSVTMEKTDPLCYLGSDGTASATASGGTEPYSYFWSNGRSTAEITGLQSGLYTVTITDMTGSTATGSVSLNDPEYLTTEVVLDDTLLTCQDRLIVASNSPEGGTAPYHYTWQYPNTNTDSSQSISITDPGTYLLTVTDAHGCTYETSFEIFSVGFPVLTTYLIDSITCNGLSNGNAAVHIEDGIAPYTISWSNGDQDTLLNDVGAGSYVVTVTDDNGCSNVAAVNVPQPQQLGIEVTHTNITCFGDRTGSVYAEVSGGTLPYSYFWNNGAMTQGQSNLGAGTYSVTVTDHHGCSITGSTTILQGQEINVVVIGEPVTCHGGHDGDASAIASNGEFPYTYTWSNGATGNQIHNISAGWYFVTVVDARNCTAVDSINIFEPFQIELSMESTPENFGMMDGTAKVTASQGVAPFTYLWSNNGTTQQITDLTSGDYYVTVTDANGCTVTGEVYVEADNCAMELHVQAINVTCHGESDGGAFPVFDVPGVEPYTFEWSNGSTDPVLTNIPAGIYTVTITDNTNCSETARFTVTQPDGFNIGYQIDQPTGPDQSTGTVRINIRGGNQPYRIVYNGNTYQDDDQIVVSNLAPGEYTWTVTDNKGCTAEVSFQIKPYTCFLTASIVQELTINCHGQSGARICAIPDDNLGPVTYSWQHGNFSQCPDNLRAGVYAVAVTDTVGCTATAEFTVTEPDELSFTNLVVNPGTGSNGSISLIISGGTAPYTYNWTKNAVQFATTRDIGGLSKGTYVLTVVDANGCRMVFDPIVLNPTATRDISSTGDISISPNPATDHLTIRFEQSVATQCNVLIYDTNGNIAASGRHNIHQQQVVLPLSDLASGVYFIRIQVNGQDYSGRIMRME